MAPSGFSVALSPPSQLWAPTGSTSPVGLALLSPPLLCELTVWLGEHAQKGWLGAKGGPPPGPGRGGQRSKDTAPTSKEADLMETKDSLPWPARIGPRTRCVSGREGPRWGKDQRGQALVWTAGRETDEHPICQVDPKGQGGWAEERQKRPSATRQLWAWPRLPSSEPPTCSLSFQECPVRGGSCQGAGAQAGGRQL